MILKGVMVASVNYALFCPSPQGPFHPHFVCGKIEAEVT